MKILIVCSGNKANFNFEKDMAFIYDQLNALKAINKDIIFHVFPIIGKGVKGYLNQREKLKQEIKKFKPDIIHTHGGHLGIVSLFQKVPNIITFHGSEINNKKTRLLSILMYSLADYSIIVSKKLSKKLMKIHGRYSVIPCGVDLTLFFPMEKTEAKTKLGISQNQKYILFSSSFDNKIKNFPLAKEVLTEFAEYTIKEVKNRTREEINLLINGAEALLMTSHSEGSPQIIKEALACNQRIVSVNVGDVEEQILGVDACFVCEADKYDLVDKLRKSIEMPKPSKGRTKASMYNNNLIAEKIHSIYKKIMEL